jgi:glycerol-3-phosphate dehydrogenase subunit C
MFKQELPLMFPDDADVQGGQEAMFDPFEYLVARNKDGLLKTDFKKPRQRVVSHPLPPAGCRTSDRRPGDAEIVPDTTVNTVERCSGHAGTWGVKKEFHETAMKIGRPVFKADGGASRASPTGSASDCQLAGHHIEQGMARARRRRQARHIRSRCCASPTACLSDPRFNQRVLKSNRRSTCPISPANR